MPRLTHVSFNHLILALLGFVVGGVGWTGLLAAEQESDIFALRKADAWRARANEVALYNNVAWKTQLLYVSRVLRPDSSIVDSLVFFNAKDGKFNLKSEMEASVDALFAPVSSEKPDEHALCRFPRRSAWLIENLQIPREILPRVNCKELERFLLAQSATGVSLVFASYYLNNPASMFGHTFLRIHRGKGPADGEPNALLDSAVNFAANPTTENAPLYAIMGLSGQFPGTFSLMPYYLKIQEYNNAESRDLWEYRLNLSQTQIDNFMLMLWELGPASIDYWYIDENCSYVLLLLLETLNPGMNLASPFNVMATPADTVRSVVSQPGFTYPPKYRPSALSTYLQREELLDDLQLRRMKQLLEAGPFSFDGIVSGLNPDEKARIIDAAIDYIDFDEQVAGSRLPEKMKQQRQGLLKLRSENRTPPRVLSYVPEGERPDLGHWSMRVGVSSGLVEVNSQRYRFYDFDWRPTLHDLSTPSSGYSSDLQLKMLEFKFRYHHSEEGSHVRMESATFFDVLSVPSVGRMKRSLSWTLNISSHAPSYDHSLDSRCYEHSLRGGVGVAGGGVRAKVFSLVVLELGSNCMGISQGHVASGLVGGFMSDLTLNTKLSLKLSALKKLYFTKHLPKDNWQRYLDIHLSHVYLGNHEVSIFGKLAPQKMGSAGLSYGLYF
jgi:hypothetical protein